MTNANDYLEGPGKGRKQLMVAIIKQKDVVISCMIG